MLSYGDRVKGGLYGLLVGDACGVPYEFTHPARLPPVAQLEMMPPKGFMRSYAHVPPGTWSDDGAQALCLLDTLMACGGYHAHHFSRRLLRWHEDGYMAVDHYVFDVGNQTSVSIGRLKAGMTVDYSGMRGVRNNGNGSLMRCLPLALLHSGNDKSLLMDAHRQSRLTHAHIRSQICCGLYCLWARRELQGHSRAWEGALQSARAIYCETPVYLKELEAHILAHDQPGGSGYVVDALHSALYACEAEDYESIIKRAIALGNDTDTTACIAGGIAGIRHGMGGIPAHWLGLLRGRDILEPILERLEVAIAQSAKLQCLRSILQAQSDLLDAPIVRYP